jgi:hypothetical protein
MSAKRSHGSERGRGVSKRTHDPLFLYDQMNDDSWKSMNIQISLIQNDTPLVTDCKLQVSSGLDDFCTINLCYIGYSMLFFSGGTYVQFEFDPLPFRFDLNLGCGSKTMENILQSRNIQLVDFWKEFMVAAALPLEKIDLFDGVIKLFYQLIANKQIEEFIRDRIVRIPGSSIGDFDLVPSSNEQYIHCVSRSITMTRTFANRRIFLWFGTTSGKEIEVGFMYGLPFVSPVTKEIHIEFSWVKGSRLEEKFMYLNFRAEPLISSEDKLSFSVFTGFPGGDHAKNIGTVLSRVMCDTALHETVEAMRQFKQRLRASGRSFKRF